MNTDRIKGSIDYEIVQSSKKYIPVEAYQTDKPMDIQTLEGVMHANTGDWIIIGVEGEMWPVKKEIFEKTYRIISEKQ